MIKFKKWAGVILRNKDEVLLCKRSPKISLPNTWSIPSGKIEDGETLFDGIARECEEEIGLFPAKAKLIPIQKFINHTFTYHTFFCEIADEFIPTLNDEHCGYAWVGGNQYPKPLHPGLFSTVNFDIVQGKLEALTKKET